MKNFIDTFVLVMIPNYLQRVFFIAGLCISPLMVLVFSSIHHPDDYANLMQWLPYASNFKMLYTTDCYCNYPILGLLSSIGIIHLLGDSFWNYQFYLACIDSVNVMLILFILKKLSINNYILWAGIIGLLPSHWAGTGIWGQFDNIILTFTLISFLLFLHKSSYNAQAFMYYLIMIVCGLMLLTKQIAIVQVAPLLAFTFYLIVQKGYEHNLHINLMVVTLMVVIFVPDIYLQSEPYSSYYFKIIETGSSHLNNITANGLNIWALLNRPMWSDANIPLVFTISPKQFGLVFFATFAIALTVYTILLLKKRILNQTIVFMYAMALLVFGFNVLLTGIHERYLYSSFPLLMITLLYFTQKHQLPKWILAVSLIGSGLYGVFVLMVLLDIVIAYPLFVVFNMVLFAILLFGGYRLLNLRSISTLK